MKVLIVAPTYNGLSHDQTGISRIIALKGDCQLGVVARSFSLLASNFNSLWAAGFSDDPPDWWLMQHGDVSAAPAGWLSKMIEIAEERGLDVLSGIIPIRNESGLTSTAIDTDRWEPRRLTMTELMAAPKTFDNGYATRTWGHPLLVNTGLLLVRWNNDWRQKITFTINDKIDYGQTPPRVLVEPEDWCFSRQIASLDIPYAATREIVITHHDGARRFVNDNAWGEQATDELWARKAEHELKMKMDGKPVTITTRRMFFAERVYDMIAQMLPEGGTFVEVGCWLGDSSAYMVHRCREIGKAASLHFVDTWGPYLDGNKNPNLDWMREAISQCPGQDMAPVWLARMECDGLLSTNVYQHKAKSVDFAAELPDGSVDAVFIDGDHAYEAAKADIRAWLPKVKLGGMLCGDDFDVSDPGVCKAVVELLPGFSRQGRHWVFRKAKA